MIDRTTHLPARRRRALGMVLFAAVVLTGCSGSREAGGTEAGTDAGTRTRTVVSTLPPLTTLTVTTGAPSALPPTSTRGSSSTGHSSSRPRSGRPSSSPVLSSPVPSNRSAAPSTSLPAAVRGDCPYLSPDQVAPLAGQRTGSGEVIATSPAPICVFIRADGGWMAAVRVFRTPDAAAAAAAVDTRIRVADSSPADRPSGWTGGYLGLPSGTSEYPEARSVYGVSRGTTAVVAWTNQAQSITSRRIVEAVIENLHL